MKISPLNISAALSTAPTGLSTAATQFRDSITTKQSRFLRTAAAPTVLASTLLGATACNQDIQLSPSDETYNVVDHLYQNPNTGPLDILTVLDKSCSMDDNNEKMGLALADLHGDLEGFIDDYRFGFIAADSFYANHDYFIGPYYSDAVLGIDLAMAPALLPSEAGREEAFAAAYSFELADRTSESPFIRNDASLLIFLVSDEDEQSGVSTPLFHEWLLTLKEVPEEQLDVVHIVTTENSSCETGLGMLGEKYIDHAENYMNKSAIDICQEDWGDWIANSTFLFQISDSIQLSDQPILDSLAVYYDIEPNDPESVLTQDWQYIPEDNRIQLGFEPERGSLVMVAYDVALNSGARTQQDNNVFDVWEQLLETKISPISHLKRGDRDEEMLKAISQSRSRKQMLVND